MIHTWGKLKIKMANETKGQIIQRNNGFFYKFDGKTWRRVCKCGTRPHFNFEGESKGIRCSKCKEPGMIDVKSPKCECGKSRPYFNFEGESKAICCSECKEPGMIDVKNPRCKCGKNQPAFNFAGESKAICCSECKEPGMIDVKNPRCECGKIPTFNFEGESKAICCSECKEPGMIDVKSPRCTHTDHDWARETNVADIPRAHFRGDGGEPLCWQHFYNEARMCRAIRREKIYLGNLIAVLPNYLHLSHDEFDQYYLGNDFNVSSCQLKRRPDMLFNFPRCAVLLEFDENGHRDRSEMSELSHLMVIKKWCEDELNQPNLYVFRINPDGNEPMFAKKNNGPSTGLDIDGMRREQVWEPTEYFKPKLEKILPVLVNTINAAIHGGDALDVFETDGQAIDGVFTRYFF